MRDAIGYLVALAVGYGIGAAHVWLAKQQREGSAYMDGYRTGQRVGLVRDERAERAK